MSRRKSIVNALATKLNTILPQNGYTTSLSPRAYPKLKFWDECNDFPSVYMSTGTETREYHPAGFAWGYLNISIKAYVKAEEPQNELELLLEDIESAINSTLGILVYNSTTQDSTSEISITSITTDEGLLAPYGVGEINILVRYQVMP